MWRETTKHERNRKIFDEEFEHFLPKRILDFHVHVFQDGVAPPGVAFSCGGHPITGYDFEALELDLAECFPGRETKAVCFGLPDPTYNLAENNRYIADHCDNERLFALRLFDPHADTPESVGRDLATGKYFGLKPYPDYTRKPNLNDATIVDMLPEWVMEIASRYHSIIMLHIPRSARLADPLNQTQIEDYATRFPRVNIVVAHIGRAYFYKNVVGNLKRFVDLPNVFVDLTMLNHADVLEYTFSHFPHDRILFGTDIPIALAPGKSVEINDQYTYVTPIPWKLSISDDHGKLKFTSFLFEELRAIKHAVDRLSLPRSFVEGVFHNYGWALLQQTRKAMTNT